MRFSRSQPFLARATPSGGGGSLVPIQRTPVVIGNYVNAAASFGSNVTAGNTILIYGSSQAGAPGTMTTNQGDTVVLDAFEGFGGNWIFSGYIASAVGGSTTLTLGDGDQIKCFYAEEIPTAPYNSAAGLGAVTNSGVLAVSTPNATTVATAISMSVWAIRSGAIIAQTVPTGWTEGARQDTQANAQFVGAYRLETVTGIKTATWPDPTTGEISVGHIRVFG